MEIIPAIDIKDGKCVRLYKGDFEKETIYSESPVEVASRWIQKGACRLHIVDLDGAREGSGVNYDIVKNIVSLGVPVQLGGGIRNWEQFEKALNLGLDRIIVGTAALEGSFLSEIAEEFGPEKTIVSLDIKNGQLRIKGWEYPSQVSIDDAFSKMKKLELKRYIYTDVSRDGTLFGPNFNGIKSMQNRTDINLIVAGGLSSMEDLVRLSRMNVSAVIIGKAAYTGDIDIQKAVTRFRED
ncbi:MAG: 1-(5-phosphoribosyl)-5-[(5-phosphoribosylamino)methylideneamino]imidazole-4-carboxamide isomerase [Dehalococcoidia bacterium]